MAAGFSRRWHTTNVLSTREFEEILLTEDDELLGMHFRLTKGSADSGFELNLFIEKDRRLDLESIPLFQRMIQSRAVEAER